MDWTAAIGRNRDALLRIAAMLFALAGTVPGMPAERLSRDVHRAVLGLLRPAESAVRRLIVIAARGMTGGRRRAGPSDLPDFAALRRDGKGCAPRFALFDPRKRFEGLARPAPMDLRISLPGISDPVFATGRMRAADDLLDAAPLCRRLEALHHALHDIAGQARRLARLRAGRRRLPPLRPGWPPGYRARTAPGTPHHAVGAVLDDCHGLALHALEPPDTS